MQDPLPTQAGAEAGVVGVGAGGGFAGVGIAGGEGGGLVEAGGVVPVGGGDGPCWTHC